MRRRRLIQVLAVVTILGSLVLWFFANHELPPAVDRKFHDSVGRALAGEALQYLKPGGELAVIIRDTVTFKSPETDSCFRGFQEALRKAGTPIADILSLQVDPLRPLAVPPGDFYELIRRSKAGSVIVSFMGPPVLEAEQRARLTDVKPAIVAFCPGTIPYRVDLRELFEAGLLKAAAIDRLDSTGKAPPREPGTGFEPTYRFVHAGDAASLESAFPTPP